MTPIRRVLASFSAAAFVAIAAAGYRQDFPLPTVAANDGLGINVQPFGRPNYDYAAMRAMGIRWVRLAFEWDSMETVRGRYDWGFYDTLLNELRAARIRPMVTIAFGNRLYTGGAKQGPTTPEGRAAYAAFARAAVAKYKGRGIVWELWNEPNLAAFWRNPDPAQYMQMLDVAVGAMRTEAPEEWIIGPGIAGLDPTYLKACLDRGIATKVDGISFHPYRFTPPETVATEIAELRGLISRYPGAARLPLINTEWGYNLGYSVFSEAEQRDALVRLVAVSLATEIPFNCLFSWRDIPASPTDNGVYGLLGAGDRPRAAYTGLRNVYLQLSGFRYAGRIFTGNDDDWVILFTNGRQEKILAWSLRNGTVTLPTMPNTFIRQRFAASAGAPNSTERIVRSAVGLPLALGGSPQIITLVGTDAGLRTVAGLPPLPVAQAIEGVAPLRSTLQRWGAYVRRLPFGASLTLSDTAVDSSDTRTGSATINSIGVINASIGNDEADTLLNRLPATANRENVGRRLAFELSVPGRPTVRFESLLVPTRPISGGLLPAQGVGPARYRIRNEQGVDFEGVLVAQGSSATREVPVRVTAGDPFVDVTIPAEVGVNTSGATLRLVSAGRTASRPLGRRPLVSLGLSSFPVGPVTPHFRVLDGNGRDVGLSASGRFIPSPAGLPTGFSVTAELAYDVSTSTGGLLLGAVTDSSLIRFTGRPREIVSWVFGDRSGNGVCAVFIDANGQYFMTKRVPITWSGWREVRWRTERKEDYFVVTGGDRSGFPVGRTAVHNPLFLVLDGSTVRRGTVGLGGLTVYGGL